LITIFAAITAVIIFREPIEDGTELIIITKPIAR
jgi:ABC-type transport system involved in multi-copper enzyme maturation permease subunit